MEKAGREIEAPEKVDDMQSAARKDARERETLDLRSFRL